MTFNDRKEYIDGIVEALKQRGHTCEVAQGSLHHVDGTFVGVWVMPKVRDKYILRIGFGLILEEHPLDIDKEKMADTILSWLNLNGEASRKRSTEK